MSSHRFHGIVVLLLCVILASRAAADGVWQLPRNGSWGQAPSWFGEVPNGVGDIASFDSFAPSLAASISLEEPVVVGSLQDANPNQITVIGIEPGELTFDSDDVLGASLVVRNDAGGLILNTDVNLADSLLVSARNPAAGITIGGALRGAGDIVKTGPGLLKLDGDNVAWQGALTVAAGKVDVSLGTGLNSVGPHKVLDGATLQLDSAGSVPVALEGGTLVLNGDDGPFSGELTISDEGLLTTGSMASPGSVIHYAGMIRLIDGAHGVISNTTTALQIDGEISGAGSIEFRNDQLSINVSAPLTHVGDVIIDSRNYERIYFDAESTYDGQTVMYGGQLLVRHTHGLGSPAKGTTLHDGLLRINAQSAEPIDLNGGILELFDFGNLTGHYTGQITTRGGTLRANTDFRTPVVDAPLVIQAGSRPVIESDNTEGLRLAGGITGTGDIELRSPSSLDIDGPLNLQGDIFITAGDNRINSQNEFNHRIIVENGGIIFNENNSVQSLHVVRGSVEVAPDKTLEVADLRLREGQINGYLSGVGSLIKPGFGKMTFVDIGSEFDGDVLIPAGVIEVGGPRGLGSAVGSTTVLREQNAMLLIKDTIHTIDENIYLNNATGFADGGGLMIEDGGSPIMTGDIDLGAVGATIGVSFGFSGGPDIRGSISGGTLTVNAESGSYVRLSGDGHSYAGATDIQRGQLIVGANGRLTTTSAILVNSGELLLENSANGSHPDRVSDTIPISLRSGTVSVEGRDDAVSNETLGTVELVNGHSEFRVFQEDYEQPSRLFIGELVRQPGSTVNFVRLSSLGLGEDTSQLHLVSLPQLVNGIIGGWATADSDFATIGPFGIAALKDNDYERDLNAATETSNVETLSAQTLVADARINSLKVFSSDTLNLGGNTLNLLSGGLIKTVHNNPSEISNGVLTAGGNNPGELFVHANRDLSITAEIVDNPGGAVSLIKSGEGRLELRGATTYTGATIINEGELEAHNLPAGGQVVVNGGTLWLESNVELASFVMYDGFVGDLSIRADEIQLSSGMVYSPFLGNGTIEKNSRGVLRNFSSLAEFEGNLQVEDGYWSVEHSFGLTPGENVVMPEGRLVINEDVHGSVQLAGGELAGNDPRSRLIGNVEVTADSKILLLKGISTLGLGIDLAVQGDIIVRAGHTLHVEGDPKAELTIDGQMVLEPGASLTGGATIVGDVDIGEGVNLEPGSSPGSMTLSNATWKSGGTYVWEINEATGQEGAPLGVGWDVVFADTVSIDATMDDPFVVKLRGLTLDGEPGNVANLDAATSYQWPFLRATTLDGFAAGHLQLDVSELVASTPGLQPSGFSILQSGGDLTLNYAPPPDVDFDGDGMISVGDVDALVAEIANSRMDLGFDLNGDGSVNGDDLSVWLDQAARQQGYASAFLPGDANLDGTVNAVDLNALGLHYLENAALWSSGDFTADGHVTSADLNLIGLHWRESISLAAAVPEPTSTLRFAILLLCCVMAWKRGDAFG